MIHPHQGRAREGEQTVACAEILKMYTDVLSYWCEEKREVFVNRYLPRHFYILWQELIQYFPKFNIDVWRHFVGTRKWALPAFQ